MMESQDLTLPPELQLAMQLEGIFMPQTWKKRKEAYERLKQSGDTSEGLRFAHYTSADAALKIIQEKRMWVRSTTCMSDYREVLHGFEILLEFFSSEPNRQRFIQALDSCAPGAAGEAIQLFDQWWSEIQFGTYIASMSEHDETENSHGRLSMWRAFGGNTARVALVFRIPKFSGGAQALNLFFSPVAYLAKDEGRALIDEVIKNIHMNSEFLGSVDRGTIIATVFHMLLAGVTCLKHEGFEEEREWRAIYSPKRSPSPLVESSTEIIGGVPQIIYKLPLDVTVSSTLAELDFSRMFDRLIIGPSQYPLVMSGAFVDALTKTGVPDAANRVFISGIPIRP